MSLSHPFDRIARPASPTLPQRLLEDDCPIAMWLFDARTLEILWTNRAMRGRYGWTAEHATARTVGDLCSSDESRDAYASFGDDADGPARTLRTRHRGADGAILDVECTITPFSPDGRRLALVHEVDATGITPRVVLPASASAQTVGSERCGPSRVRASRRGRVLVIDDEPKLAMTLRVLLEDEHEIVSVTRARDALAMLEGGERFDVALCDLMMPEINGAEFYEAVARTLPSFSPQIVFLTGGAFTDSTREFLARVENPCVEKPFDVSALRSLIAKLVELSSAP